jgi:hypothetical protein
VSLKRGGLIGNIHPQVLSVDVQEATSIRMAWELGEVIGFQRGELFGPDAGCLCHVI